MIYNENLKFLKEHAGELYNMLVEASPAFEHKVTYLEGQDNILIENETLSLYVHSRYDKRNEAEMMFRNMPEDTEIVILFGVGCGHGIEYLLKNPKKIRYLIIVEPMQQIFKDFLKRYRLQNMGKIGKFTCIVNLKGEKAYLAIKHALTGELGSKFFFAYHVSYRTAFKDYYHALQENVFRLMRVDKALLASEFIAYKIKAVNYIENLKVDCLPVEGLEELFRQQPVVIVSAGPSLNKNIHQIEALKNRAIIVAVGSAIKILDSKGIIPHFRMSFEWNPRVQKLLFEGLENTQVPLIFTDQLYYKILPAYNGYKFRMVIESDLLTRQVMKYEEINHNVYHNGISVANIAAGLFCKMGCSHIIFMGQDMCFVENKLFAEGRSQVSTGDHEKNLIEGKDIYDNKVYSIIQYLQIKYDLESLIKRYPGIKFINATEGGLGIEGAENTSIPELISKELISDLTVCVDQYVRGLYSQEAIETYRREVKKGMGILSHEVEEMLTTCTEILKIYKELHADNGREEDQEDIKKCHHDIFALEQRVESMDLYTRVIAIAMSPIFRSLEYQSKKDISLVNITTTKAASIMEYCLLLKTILE